MKFTSTLAGLALLGTSDAKWSNSVPIQSTVPGWQIGTKGADIEFRIFYDLLCPASKADHENLVALLKKASPIEGKTYNDLLNVKITPFVLPYHLHGYNVARVVPYLQDLCLEDAYKCKYMEEYAHMTWGNMELIAATSDVSEQDFFNNTWAPSVGIYMYEPKEDILQLITP